MTQRPGALQFAAAGTPISGEPMSKALLVPGGKLALVAGNARNTGAHAETAPAPASCQQCLTLSFFFDGTGNNLDADVGTLQHSNIARLFQCHLLDAPTLGRFAFYVPGLGTYFKDIGDDGHTARGLGTGHRGQDRLDWAFKKFDESVKRAEARALNPTNKIIAIKVSVFGFSRGATAARAFVRDLAERCDVVNGQYKLKAGRYPVEVIFLGIFDTVASVGLPMSANNTPGARTAGWMSTETAMRNARDIISMAFGEPGADPAPGTYDGHASWADGLRVPSPGLVKRCVHMVAGHEIRNSFPVDSVLDGTRYPDGTVEMVYPGAHSDVGGGYQPGEGARCAHYGEMLSLVPLRAMHQEARAAGVPLDSLNNMVADGSAVVLRSFALDKEGAEKFAELSALHANYFKVAGSGGRDIGRELLAHSSWYLRWRFFNIRRNQQSPQGAGPDAQTIAQREPGFAAERRRMQTAVDGLKAELDRASSELGRAQQAEINARMAQARMGVPVDPGIVARTAAARQREAAARDAYLAEKARLDTYANDSELAANLQVYDRRLLQDAQAIVAHQKANPTLPIRPHYRNLVDAYNAQYVRREPLDARIVAFFDRYVHDSLAGFATDATLPSDPRVIYVGGDNKMRYAAVSPPGGAQTQSRAA